jgi:hypothetical protein
MYLAPIRAQWRVSFLLPHSLILHCYGDIIIASGRNVRYTSALKLETTGSCEMLLAVDAFTWWHYPEYHNLNVQRFENFRSQIGYFD